MILEEAIKQHKFKSLQHKTALNLYYTQAQLHSFSSGLLKPYGISVQQFNILRILRGQKGNVIGVSEISERMIDKMSNTSRLVEKLRQKNLVQRRECPEDRRKAEISITPEGLSLINEASGKVDQQLMDRLQILSEEELSTINILLDKLNQ
ncbi:MAG: MarR family transcriptional regulator [Saprospiraceae bacterium]|nr:MarR family transcriptional regulator [Saprospiraceae bacterium]